MTDSEKEGGLATAIMIAWCGVLALVLRGALVVLYAVEYWIAPCVGRK